MRPNRFRPPAFLVLGLLTVAAEVVTAQSVDSTPATLPALVAGLPNGALVRFADDGRRWSGRLTARSLDSLTLTGERETRTIHLGSMDSMWVRGRASHSGLLAGAGFGALMFGLLKLGGESSEDPGLNTSLGLAIFLGSAAAGLAADLVSDPWVQRYPGKP